MPRISPALLAAAALALLAPPGALAAPGDLDPAFGGDGRIDGPPPAATSSDVHVAPAGDGGAVMAWAGSGTAAGTVFVRRVTADGTPVAGFGDADGTAALDLADDVSVIGLEVVEQGRIVVGADVSTGTGFSLVAAKLTADGDPYTGFGGATGVSDPIRVNGHSTSGAGMAIGPDGRITLLGEVFDAGAIQFAVTQLTPAGALDARLDDPDAPGGHGRVFGIAGKDAVPRAVSVDPAGRIVVAGQAADDAGGAVFVARVEADGDLDAGFGTGGVRGLDVGGEADAAGVAATAQGVVVGFDASSRREMGVVRLTGTGAVDASYGSGGASVTDAAEQVAATAMALGPDGSVVLAGQVTGAPRWAVARFTAGGAPDTGFGGGGGVATFAMGPGSASSARDVAVQGDAVLVGGITSVLQPSFQVVPSAVRVLAGPSSPGSGDPGGGEGGGGQPPAPAQPVVTQPATPVVVAAGPPALRVFGTEFVIQRSTKRRVRILDMTNGQWHFSSGQAVFQDRVPYADVAWDFTSDDCTAKQDGIIVGQTPKGVEVEVDQSRPVQVRFTVCLHNAAYVRSCSAAKINTTLKKAGRDNLKFVDAVFDELGRCKVDYDVRLTKKAEEAAVAKISNTAPPKSSASTRKVIQQVIDCPSDPAQQDLRLLFSEGASQGASYGFHYVDDDPRNWTLPAGVPSYFKVTVWDRAKRFAKAKVIVDTDAVGSPQLPPVTLNRDSVHAEGERIFKITPTRPGVVRVCALLEVASDGDGPQYLVGTGSFRVGPEPKVGESWTTLSGRTLKMAKGGPTVVASSATAAPQARAANWFTDAFGWLKSLFGGTSRSVNAADGAGGSGEKKLAQAKRSGNGLAQMPLGGMLKPDPGLPSFEQGHLTLARGAEVGSGLGQVIKANPKGTLMATGSGVVAAGGGNVVSAGGGNVVSAGGGNVVSAGGGNVISAGGANVVSAGGANVIAAGGGNVVAPGGGN